MSDFRKRQSKPRNPWTITQPRDQKPENIQNAFARNSERFTEASKKHQAAAQKYVLDYDTSSEEDELESGNIISMYFPELNCRYYAFLF